MQTKWFIQQNQLTQMSILINIVKWLYFNTRVSKVQNISINVNTDQDSIAIVELVVLTNN